MYKAKLYKEYHDGMRTTTQIAFIESTTMRNYTLKCYPPATTALRLQAYLIRKAILCIWAHRAATQPRNTAEQNTHRTETSPHRANKHIIRRY